MVFLFRQTGGFGKVYHFICTKIWSRGERCGLQAGDPLALLGYTLFPRMIEFEVTTRCHLRCVYCERTFFPSHYANWNLTWIEFLQMMEQFPKLRYVNATGEGSAFANPDFPAMLRWLRNHDIYTTVIDSFSRISDDQMQLLIDCASKVPISLDGVGSSYEAVRPPAKWDATCANIRRFLELRGKRPMPEVIFRMVYCQQNYHTLVEYPREINALMGRHRQDGYDGFIEFVGLLDFPETRHMVWEPTREVVEATEDQCRKYGLKWSWSHPSHLQSQMRDSRECAAYAEPFIMKCGDVISCCALLMSNDREHLHQIAFGNINQQSFEEIWNSERYRQFRRNVNRGELPKSCYGCRAFATKHREVE